MNQYRKDFPILNRQIGKYPLIYLDNAATTQKPLAVIDHLRKAYSETNANVHRGVHFLSREATELHEAARKRVAQFIHAGDSAEILFTRGTTESINLVAWSFCEKYLHTGDEVIVSTMEHHSNIVPWQMACERKGATLKVIPLTESDELDMEAFKNLLSEKTRLVSVAYISNVLGTINPVEEIVRLSHEAGAKVLIDGAQAVAHKRVDVDAIDADFFVFSGHKIYAPTGMGILYGKKHIMEELPPYQGGGEMIEKVTFAKTTYQGMPYRFEAGTPDYIGSTALAKALDYVEGIGLERIAAHEDHLLQLATEGLKTRFSDVRIIGNAPKKSGVLSFVLDGIHPYDLGMLLDQLGIAIRTGHHCAMPLLESYGLESTARASFALYNTEEEVYKFLEGLERVVPMLR